MMMVAVAQRGGDELGFARWILEPTLIGEAEQACAKFLEAFSLGVHSFVADYLDLLDVDATLIVASASPVGFSQDTLRAIRYASGMDDLFHGQEIPSGSLNSAARSCRPRLCFVAYQRLGSLAGMRARNQLDRLGGDPKLKLIPIALRPGYPEHSVALTLHRVEVALKSLNTSQ